MGGIFVIRLFKLKLKQTPADTPLAFALSGVWWVGEWIYECWFFICANLIYRVSTLFFAMFLLKQIFVVVRTCFVVFLLVVCLSFAVRFKWDFIAQKILSNGLLVLLRLQAVLDFMPHKICMCVCIIDRRKAFTTPFELYFSYLLIYLNICGLNWNICINTANSYSQYFCMHGVKPFFVFVICVQFVCMRVEWRLFGLTERLERLES